jgi:hypothetical protein
VITWVAEPVEEFNGNVCPGETAETAEAALCREGGAAAGDAGAALLGVDTAAALELVLVVVAAVVEAAAVAGLAVPSTALLQPLTRPATAPTAANSTSIRDGRRTRPPSHVGAVSRPRSGSGEPRTASATA